MRIDYPNTLERTAIHEASHALVAELSSRLPGVREVVARAVEGGGYCQLEATEPALEATEGDREARHELLEQGIRLALAGPVGEMLAFGKVSDATLRPSEGRDRTDLETAAALSLQIQALYLDTGHGSAAARAQDAERRASAAMDRALDVAEFLLRTSWSAVERIASAIIQCGGTAPGELVRTLIDTTPRKMLPCATLEQDLELLKKAAVADRGLGEALLRFDAN